MFYWFVVFLFLEDIALIILNVYLEKLKKYPTETMISLQLWLIAWSVNYHGLSYSSVGS